MSSERIERVNSLIAHELGQIFIRELELPRSVILTITRVDTTADLSFAHVSISVLPLTQEKTIMAMLNKRIYHLQKLLNKKVIMHNVPKLVFKPNRTEAQAARIESLLDELKKTE